MAMWNRCAICGRAIPVGELCYGVKNWRGDPDGGDTICRDCLVPENSPTLTPPNDPLTPNELREMDGPVWVACKPIEGGNGYWCLCQRGNIVTPAGSIFDAKEIPHWAFYRRPPEGEENQP